jgi:hypothetical protein
LAANSAWHGWHDTMPRGPAERKFAQPCPEHLPFAAGLPHGRLLGPVWEYAWESGGTSGIGPRCPARGGPGSQSKPLTWP